MQSIKKAHSSKVWKCEVSPHGDTVMSFGEHMKFWDAHGAQLPLRLSPQENTNDGSNNNLSVFCFSPDGKTALVKFKNEVLRLWDCNEADKDAAKKHAFAYSLRVNSCRYSFDGKLIATTSKKGNNKKNAKLIIWDATKAGSVVYSEVVEGEQKCCCFSPNGAKIVVGLANAFKVVDLSTKASVQQLELSFVVKHCQFSDNGRLVVLVGVSSDYSTQIQLYDVEEKKLLPLLGLPRSEVAILHDASLVAAAARTKFVVEVYSLLAEQPSHAPVVLKGHSDHVDNLVFNGHTLYSTSKNELFVWKLSRDMEEGSIHTPTHQFYLPLEIICLAVRGHTVFCGTTDGTTYHFQKNWAD